MHPVSPEWLIAKERYNSCRALNKKYTELELIQRAGPSIRAFFLEKNRKYYDKELIVSY
jgi:hypothetical protein